jgi:magnesium-transporting ATPase (P-type)
LLIIQILSLCYNKDDIAEKVQRFVDTFAERGLRSLAVAYQVYEHQTVYFRLSLLRYCLVKHCTLKNSEALRVAN